MKPYQLEPDIFMTVIVIIVTVVIKKLPSSARVLVNLLDGEVLLSDTMNCYCKVIKYFGIV